MGPIPNFNSITDILEEYSNYSPKIRVEGRIYVYVNVLFEGEVKKLIYRCEPEKHNLVITKMGDVVIEAVGVYSIHELVAG